MAGDAAISKLFTFHFLPSRPFPSLDLKENKERIQKWGLDSRLIAQTYSFDEQFKPYQAESFALNFFQSDEVARSIKVVSSSGSACYGLGIKVPSVQVENVPCTCVSMSLFDKLEQNQIVQDTGYIRKCFEEYIEGVPVADQLRNVLINEDFDKYDIYSEEERSEFLFRLFTHLCIGGGICQYEDTVTPYVQHTKLLYKDLINVQKDPESRDLHVTSHVYKVDILDDEGDVVFPDDKLHLNSFCYLCVDPIKRHVTILQHKYGGGLW